MRVLLIKTSSLGDVIHTLPAITDAVTQIPSLQFDWVLEQNFSEVPQWHSGVVDVIPVAIRHWRKHWFQSLRQGELSTMIKALRARKYDLIIDAQGLWKSGILARLARGPRCGFDRHSAREGSVSCLYQKTVNVSRQLHAVERLRVLFSKALGYTLPSGKGQYGVVAEYETAKTPYVIFFHGTTWATKHWPEAYWADLAQRVGQVCQIRLPWGNEEEKARAERLAAQCSAIEVLPKLSLTALKDQVAGARGVVAVDTGLGHLAAALSIPTVSLYGSTNPALTATYGENQVHLHANYACAPCLQRDCRYTREASAVWPPCFTTVQPEQVWDRLRQSMDAHAMYLNETVFLRGKQ